MRKAKPIVQVDLTGNISELLYAEFQDIKVQNEKLMNSDEQNKIKMDQMLDEIKQLRNNPKITYTIEETAKMLNMSKRTLDKCREQNLIKCCKFGDKVWFTMKQIEDFNDRCEINVV